MAHQFAHPGSKVMRWRPLAFCGPFAGGAGGELAAEIPPFRANRNRLTVSLRFQSVELHETDEDEITRSPSAFQSSATENAAPTTTRSDQRDPSIESRASAIWPRINSLRRHFELSAPPLIQTSFLFIFLFYYFLRVTNLGGGNHIWT